MIALVEGLPGTCNSVLRRENVAVSGIDSQARVGL